MKGYHHSPAGQPAFLVYIKSNPRHHLHFQYGLTIAARRYQRTGYHDLDIQVFTGTDKKAAFINELTMRFADETDRILFPYQDDKIHLQAVTEQSEGRTLLIDDTALKEWLFEEHSFLKEGLAVGMSDDHTVVIFRLHTGAAWFWIMESNTRESEAERIPS